MQISHYSHCKTLHSAFSILTHATSFPCLQFHWNECFNFSNKQWHCLWMHYHQIISLEYQLTPATFNYKAPLVTSMCSQKQICLNQPRFITCSAAKGIQPLQGALTVCQGGGFWWSGYGLESSSPARGSTMSYTHSQCDRDDNQMPQRVVRRWDWLWDSARGRMLQQLGSICGNQWEARSASCLTCILPGGNWGSQSLSASISSSLCKKEGQLRGESSEMSPILGRQLNQKCSYEISFTLRKMSHTFHGWG